MITEDQLEQLAIQWFQDTGWTYANAADLAPEVQTLERADFRAVVLKTRLAAAVQRLNPKLPSAAVEEVVHVVTTPTETSLVSIRRKGRRPRSHWCSSRPRRWRMRGLPLSSDLDCTKRGHCQRFAVLRSRRTVQQPLGRCFPKALPWQSGGLGKKVRFFDCASRAALRSR